MRPRSPYHFSFFRIALGAYLCVHFVELLPYAAEVWGPHGLLPDPALNLTHGVLPNILSWTNRDAVTTGFVALLALCAVGLAIGWQRPVMALVLWYGWACLFDRNNLTANPGMPYVGWLLLVCAVVPRGEPLGLTRVEHERPWALPRMLYIGAWVLMAVGYTISGIDKWMAPSWRDGSAIVHLLENPLARDTYLRTWLLTWPDALHRVMTWSILAMEALFLPLALFRRTRLLAWGGMVLMHLGILCIVDFADLTIGMLMIHFFTLDERWLKPARIERATVYFDGVCGLCNSFVDLLMQEDRSGVLRFAPLQGTTAHERVPALAEGELSTVVYEREDRVYTKSGAAIRILRDIGGVWKLTGVLLVLPAPLRDRIYAWVARNRYKWFGQKEACRMPTPEERSRFLP